MRMTDSNQNIPTTTKNSQDDDISFVSIRFMCQVVMNGEVIETRTSTDEEMIDNWIFTFKEVYSKYGKKAKYLKGVLTEC